MSSNYIKPDLRINFFQKKLLTFLKLHVNAEALHFQPFPHGLSLVKFQEFIEMINKQVKGLTTSYD